MKELDRKTQGDIAGEAKNKQAPKRLGFFSLMVRKAVDLILDEQGLNEVCERLRGGNTGERMGIMEELVGDGQGGLAMVCLSLFPDIDQSTVIRRLIETNQGGAVVYNQFRIGELDLETRTMVDREYYRIAPLMFRNF